LPRATIRFRPADFRDVRVGDFASGSPISVLLAASTAFSAPFPFQACAGINFTRRTRLAAAADRQKIQPTRRRPRNFIRRIPPVPLIHPKFFSISFRFS